MPNSLTPIINWFKSAFEDKPVIKARGYDLAQRNRLMADFVTSNQTFDQGLRTAPLPLLRDRSRDLARNDTNAVKFLSLLAKNVLGSDGIKLQSKVMMQRGGKPNVQINTVVQDGWADWGKKKNCTITTKFTWIQVQHLILSAVAIDGEVFIRKLRRPDNPHLFSLQFIDPDQVDFFLNSFLPNGNRIIMGVELNQDGAPVAYWVYNTPLGDSAGPQPRQRVRIDASEIEHIYRAKSPFQTRGVPWMVSAAYRMHMLKKYDEAELLAARIGACQMGFIQKTADPNPAYKGADANPDQQDGQSIETEPGMFYNLAEGETVGMFKPEHPVSAFDAFSKACVRDIAAGLDVAYMSLSGDLGEASFSSARVGLLDERDTYKMLQTWMIESVCEPIYDAWLNLSFLSYLKPLPISVFDYPPCWHPRSFPWVDPLKDIQARIMAIGAGLDTRTRAINEQGYDLDETLEELQTEEKLIDKLGIHVSLDSKTLDEATSGADSTTIDPPAKNGPAKPNGHAVTRLTQ